MLILQRPWRQQPQGAVSIDWGNPITQGLDYAVVNSVEWVSRSVLGSTVGVSARGRTQRLVAPYKTSADVPDCTIVANHRYTSNNGDYAGVVWGFYISSVVNSQNGIGYGELSSGGGDVYGVNRANGGGTTWLYNNVATPYDVVLATRGVISGGVASDVFLNGVKSGTTISQSGSNAFAVDSRRQFEVFLPTSTGKESAFAYKFGRLLSDAEIVSLSANPWQLFRPRRIYIPTAAAAAAPTITALSARLITATSAQPRISYS